MDRYKASSFATFNGPLATGYDRSFGPRFCRMSRWDEAVVTELGARLDGARVLDVGCATGRLLARLASRAGHAAGVDLAPRILETARRRLESLGRPAELRTGDAETRLPWAAGTFDVVTMTGVLHHFSRPERALAEIHRVARDGACVVVVDPGFFPPVRQLFNALLRLTPVSGDCRFRAPQDAWRLLARSGFRPREPRRVATWSYLVAATRVEGPHAQAPVSQ
jgi:ubiquinone/menaquinone biosynthesis C-methylase UbiE